MKTKIALVVISLILVTTSIFFLVNMKIKMPSFIGKNYEEVVTYFNNKKYSIEKIEEYSNTVAYGYVINQSINDGAKLNKKDKIVFIVSLGINYIKLYNEYQVDELGNVPVMMYHGIWDIKSDETAYTGGNVDSSGYNRTTEAFRNDLEFYYQNNYRMIPLKDYVNGIIDVEIGKTPIVLTFDDGQKNNILVTGLDQDGNIMIDPNSAVGILEEFKQKHPDFNVTATFFVNGSLFNQREYNSKILNWLVDNGYDIGNHSYNHADFNDLDLDKVPEEVGKLYQLLDTIIPNKYVNIMALPFGSPKSKTNPNFASIVSGTYNNINYETISTLQVGWTSNYSPFSNNFDKHFIKRIRAYDNNGLNFDIQMCFKTLENNRYISDGDLNKIVVKNELKDSVNKNNNLEVITY
jgi:peptidoglycan/xylan/chitin deacetylase (PgdA/CDA1 family)